MDETWTIGELAERAAEVLGTEARVNGRVRDVPNERLIRWYATIGLLDPPLARRGRVALYGPRHLLQLVAVKRRQAAGRSIADIQLELTGAPNATLQTIANLPNADLSDPSYPPEPEHASPPSLERFWAAAPTRAPATRAEVNSAEPPSVRAPSVPAPEATLMHGVRIAPGVALVLDGATRAPSQTDLAAVTVAAQPLLRALADLGLITPPAVTASEGTPS
ncbi:MerR family transcriptional regulator [Acrocarpospora catenulata]|uniref:MerR family transcriptional regulator n=1 Tax=Acrocarpospora catenulata TaxID=2836182 RepID=UPI001BD981E9|nr:MerR family transcriptional regulator [Acrocarpospora catenulata]